MGFPLYEWAAAWASGNVTTYYSCRGADSATPFRAVTSSSDVSSSGKPLSRVDTLIYNYLYSLKSSYNVLSSKQSSEFQKAMYYYKLGEKDRMLDTIRAAKHITIYEQKELWYNYSILYRYSYGSYDFRDIFSKRKRQLHTNHLSTYISGKIALYEIHGMGRGYVAQEDIGIGEVVLVERCFLIGNFEQMFYQLQILEKISSPSRLRVYLSLVGGKSDYSYESMCEKCDRNCFDISEQLFEDYKFADDQTGLFLHSSFFNHSCCYNVESIFYNDYVVKVACRPVRRGEQLFNTYNDVAIEGLGAFIRTMQSDYLFRCQCAVCARVTSEADVEQFDRLFHQFEEQIGKAHEGGDSAVVRRWLCAAQKTLRDVCCFLGARGWNFQYYLQDAYRRLTGQMVRYVVVCRLPFSVVLDAADAALRHVGIDADAAVNDGALVFADDAAAQFVSYSFAAFIVYAAFIHKYCGRTWNNLLGVARAYFAAVFGAALQLDFDAFYHRELRRYGLCAGGQVEGP